MVGTHHNNLYNCERFNFVWKDNAPNMNVIFSVVTSYGTVCIICTLQRACTAQQCIYRPIENNRVLLLIEN